MPPESQAQITALIEAQGQSQQALTRMATVLATQAAKNFDGWYDSNQIAKWASELAASIEGIQARSASTTDAYLTQLLAMMKGSPVSPSGAVDVSGLRKGVTHTEVYGRVADQYRYQRSLGKSEGESLDSAVARAEELAETDVQLAQRGQAQKFMKAKRVSGWRRIIHPELSLGGTCGLCAAASSRFYHREDLMPLHNRCHCSVAPIVNSIDPGQILNKADLNKLYEQAGGTNRSKLKKVKYVVHQNEELGPVLAPAA